MTILLSLALLAALVQPQTTQMSPTLAEPAPLSAEQQAALRCSVAIAMAAEQQRAGTGEWPDLQQRGREFFVRSLAQLMDETGLSRAGLAGHIQGERDALQQPGRLEEAMPACLLMLELSGL